MNKRQERSIINNLSFDLRKIKRSNINLKQPEETINIAALINEIENRKLIEKINKTSWFLKKIHNIDKILFS